MTEASISCPNCGHAIAIGDAFCESCGAALATGSDAVPNEAAIEHESLAVPKTTLFRPPGTTDVCLECGSEVLDDGFCSVCGKKALSPRDHWRENPVEWIGGVCDKGIVHARNEDAMALAGLADRSLAVLVVCDGVTSAPDSDRAALMAAREACASLVGTPMPATDTVAATVSHWSAAIRRACAEANAAAVGVARSLGNPIEPPSCTFIAAVANYDVITIGWCGDSRAYWLPDAGEPLQLMLDHSLGTELIQSGMSEAEAQADATFHTITRWLGADSVDSSPELSSHQVRQPGWLLVCSDGLWNYASPASAIHALLRQQLAAGLTEPVPIADGMVRWANAQGGHDNITAVLARYEPSLR